MKRILFISFILLFISLSSEHYLGFKYRKNNKFKYLDFNKFRNNPRIKKIHNSGSYVKEKNYKNIKNNKKKWKTNKTVKMLLSQK